MKLNKVVIVLGKRLVNDELTAEGRSRVEALAEMLTDLCFDTTALVFCGGVTKGQSVSEAEAMYTYFRQLAAFDLSPFPQRQIIIENRSLNTVQNMQNAALELQRSGLCQKNQRLSIVLLSNDYHLARILEIQTLMDEQGLLRVLKSRCSEAGVELDIPLDINQHISVPYPHAGVRSEAFLLIDELTTYRVYLEGVKRGAFQRDLASVKLTPFAIANQAIESLQGLVLGEDVYEQVEEVKKAIEMAALDDSVRAAEQALVVIHPILTALNQRLDPETIA
ncbi:YdcF family protein [Vibrio alfacsensis]|uniref:YdcF family protein n=1 Tax=Vibrio alfacsensis TaxID=1074311 RepID=UPI004069735C